MRYFETLLQEYRRKRIISNEILLSLKDRDDVLIHFSNEEKVGIKPLRSYHSTPTGIYGYPLKFIFINYHIDNIRDLYKLPYAHDRDYLILIFVNNEARKIYMNEKIEPDDIKKIEEYFNLKIYDDDYALKKAKKVSPNAPKEFLKTISEIFFRAFKMFKNYGDILKTFSNYSDIFFDPKFMNYFFRKILNYNYIVDPGTGSIHENEPTQAVVLDPKIVEKYEIYDNQESVFNIERKFSYYDFSENNYHSAFQRSIFTIVKENKRDEILKGLKLFLYSYLHKKNNHYKFKKYYEKYKEIFKEMSKLNKLERFNYILKLSKIDDFFNFLFLYSIIPFFEYYLFIHKNENESLKNLIYLLSVLVNQNLLEKIFTDEDLLSTFYRGTERFFQAFENILNNVDHNSEDVITPEYLDLFDFIQNEKVKRGDLFLRFNFSPRGKINSEKLSEMNKFYSMMRNSYIRKNNKVIDFLGPLLKRIYETDELKKHQIILKEIFNNESFRKNRKLFEIANKLTLMSKEELEELLNRKIKLTNFSKKYEINNPQELKNIILKILST